MIHGHNELRVSGEQHNIQAQLHRDRFSDMFHDVNIKLTCPFNYDSHIQEKMA